MSAVLVPRDGCRVHVADPPRIDAEGAFLWLRLSFFKGQSGAKRGVYEKANTEPSRCHVGRLRGSRDGGYVGQLVRGLGYWRLGGYNVGDARFRWDRVDTSGAVP